MEVYDVAKMGRPKSANPKNTLIGTDRGRSHKT